ncbi:MAG: phosphoribosylaminoimidazolesuccinocarboxamide synthase [Xanthomonadales bacterium]|nr:phosphoribosylaminoimidazolesuccinocarboxamide synthase [Xanthomonadales bacterium]NIN60072.1 phosphoribosylaminoimidazolesuccinocarboxamide synthase [Xanthomonadales bacterium]NIN75442.1 phosphoribosylaminoimidazolesuccinocarboxamide synthase [Xanthomonadales bacterium]NIO13538.1 phosphoribosylaminoimidazolesuccinocarboxamide synthase [Xanthomonadales bacterium]NIP12465.1 phosphoribosylaminoimidazolesuccinocarboxamide synthase [Xanthomonadales bacterium]
MTSDYHAGLVSELPLIHQGKVRDCFAVDDQHMLIVASDRLSAFDVVLPDPIPGKGEMLTRISNFWFGLTEHIIPNHLTGIAVSEVLSDRQLAELLAPRAVVVKRLKPLPLEAIVRGYLIGSGWKDYQRSGEVCGIALPPGLQLADRLPEIIFTPSTKAAVGEHDVNVDFTAISQSIGQDMAERVREVSIEIFRTAGDHARERGIIIADTKFEFGLDADGTLRLMDEVLTPDSSRFWPADSYRPGSSPPSYDKQFVRDYLERIGWDKTPPGPRIPGEVIEATHEKYREVCERLVASG